MNSTLRSKVLEKVKKRWKISGGLDASKSTNECRPMPSLFMQWVAWQMRQPLVANNRRSIKCNASRPFVRVHPFIALPFLINLVAPIAHIWCAAGGVFAATEGCVSGVVRESRADGHVHHGPLSVLSCCAHGHPTNAQVQRQMHDRRRCHRQHRHACGYTQPVPQRLLCRLEPWGRKPWGRKPWVRKAESHGCRLACASVLS